MHDFMCIFLPIPYLPRRRRPVSHAHLTHTDALHPGLMRRTYYFITAGCYTSLGNRDKAQELLDAMLDLLSRKRWCPFYPIDRFPLLVSIFIPLLISLANYDMRTDSGVLQGEAEAACFEHAPARGAHQGAPPHVALAVPSPFLPAVDEKHVVTAEASADLDTPNRRAPRLLLLGIMHRTLHLYAPTLRYSRRRAGHRACASARESQASRCLSSL
ncbi:hypothetical protein C8R44DRAFT_988708 [Mycena epipterygia]|nr:hypothetical protein C8R44DRAFT_988708 [Mycena epipterygia]